MRFRDIVDGTSNTLAVGERASKVTRSDGTGVRNARAAIVFSVRGTREDSPDGMADALASGEFAINEGINDSRTRRTYSSAHVGGIHALMCDGAVKFIGENIDHKLGGGVDSTFEALIGIDDEVIFTLE